MPCTQPNAESAPLADTPRFAVYDVDEALAQSDPLDAAEMLAEMMCRPAKEWRDHEVDFYQTHTAIVRVAANGIYAWWTNISDGMAIVNTERVFRQMGAVEAADLLREAISLFPNGNPPVTYPEIEQAVHSVYEANQKFVEEISSSLQEMEEDLSLMLIEWVRSNRASWLKSRVSEHV
jgi:hypothetical protein